MKCEEAKARCKKKRIPWSPCEQKFKSESCIDELLKGKDSMFDAHEKTSGGYISRKKKLVLH